MKHYISCVKSDKSVDAYCIWVSVSLSQCVIESECHMSQSGLVTNAMTQTHMSMWSLQALLIMAWFAMQCANTRLLAIHLHSPCAPHPFSLWLLGQGQRWSHCLLVSYSLRNANTFTFFGDLCLAAWLLASSTQASRGSTSVYPAEDDRLSGGVTSLLTSCAIN